METAKAPNPEPQAVHPIVRKARDLRATALTLGIEVQNLRKEIASKYHPALDCSDSGEMVANATLAFRHVEDARMRLGKVIQAFDGGQSCYPA